MKRIAALLLCLSLIVMFAACQKRAFHAGSKPEEEHAEASLGSIDHFTFTLTWGCYGVSSYDSKTGKLVKTTDAMNPKDYVTTYRLTVEQRRQIYALIEDLQVTGYPDTYDPHDGGLMSAPSMTLILSVRTDTLQKTIRAADIALTYEADNKKGRKFLTVCKAISDLLTETEEWKALPEYEFFYD